MSGFVKGVFAGIMLTLTVLFGGAFYANAETLDCKTHKLYCKIVKFNPRIDRALAMQISNKIYSKAKIHGVKPEVALALLMHETGLRNLHTYKTSTKVSESCDDKGCTRITTTVDKVFDMSIAQINVNTAIHYGFDLERLYKLDMDYALDCFFIILEDKKRICNSLGKTPAWSCYHSTTDEYRMLYIDLVKKYL